MAALPHTPSATSIVTRPSTAAMRALGSAAVIEANGAVFNHAMARCHLAAARKTANVSDSDDSR